MAVRLFDGYPQSEGAKIGAVADVTGPSSYPAAGFTLEAVSFGLSHFDFITGIADSTAVYIPFPYTPSGTNKPSATAHVIVYSTSAGLPVAVSGFTQPCRGKNGQIVPIHSAIVINIACN